MKKKTKKFIIRHPSTADEIRKAVGITKDDVELVEKILNELKLVSRTRRKKVKKGKAVK